MRSRQPRGRSSHRMRLRVFLAGCTFLLAFAVVQSGYLQSHATNADPAITTCDAGEPARGDCTPASPGSPPLTTSYTVLARGCSGGDLHVMPYEPAPGAAPLVATWCK